MNIENFGLLMREVIIKLSLKFIRKLPKMICELVDKLIKRCVWFA